MGSNRNKPTANQVVSPTAMASAIIHKPTRWGPKNALKRRAITSAPPDSASNLPSITPNAITAAIPPSVAPSPSWKADRTFVNLSPAPPPRTSAASNRPRNGFSFSLVTSRTRRPTEPAARKIRVQLCALIDTLDAEPPSARVNWPRLRHGTVLDDQSLAVEGHGRADMAGNAVQALAELEFVRLGRFN